MFSCICICAIVCGYTTPRWHALNVDRFNVRKWLFTRKGKKKMIPRTNNYGHRQCWWQYFWQIHSPRPNPVSLEKEAGGIGLHVNPVKTEYMCFMFFNQNKVGDSLKLVDKFTYLESSVSSTENDVNTRLGKAWTAIERLSVIWKRNLSGWINTIFSNQQSCPCNCMDATYGR